MSPTDVNYANSGDIPQRGVSPVERDEFDDYIDDDIPFEPGTFDD
jgi:hypothetical protein